MLNFKVLLQTILFSCCLLLSLSIPTGFALDIEPKELESWGIDADEIDNIEELDINDLAAILGWKPLEVTGDAIPWQLFNETKEVEVCTVDEDGFDNCWINPEYSPTITQYHNQTVTLMGYMFPLEQSDKQGHFLIGPYPLSCPFHYHVNFSQIIEVRTKKPIKFSYEPLTLKGTLSASLNEETGLFYVLSEAVAQ